MKNEKGALFGRKLLWAVFIIVAYSVIFNNFFFLSKDMIYGDSSAERIFPRPFYGFMRVPESKSTLKHEAANRLAADFAQIYFPSQNISTLSKNYINGRLDPWDRRSRYAPFIHYLCSLTICKLNYGMASFLHMLVQMSLFYLIFIAAFKVLEIGPDVRLGLLLVNILLFVTPAGLAWFERGQFSLYVALSHLLLIVGLVKNRLVFVILSALCAYVKWTSFPFLVVVFIVFLFSSSNRKEWTRNILLALVFLLPIALLSLWFGSETIYFLRGLYRQELFIKPEGISLTQMLPAGIVKGLPVVLMFLGWLHIRKNSGSFSHLIPYLIGSGIILLIYPTVAYEYNLACLFCFIPLVFYWAKLPNIVSRALIHNTIKFSFFFFLVLASYSEYANWFFDANLAQGVFLLIAIALLLVPLIYPGEFFFRSHKESAAV